MKGPIPAYIFYPVAQINVVQYVCIVAYISDLFVFQVKAISGVTNYTQYTPSVCSAMAGKRNVCVCVCETVSSLIEDRCTAELVG